MSAVAGLQQCILCGRLAEEECADCFKEPVFSSAGFKFFCKTCSAQVLHLVAGCPVMTYFVVLEQVVVEGIRMQS